MQTMPHEAFPFISLNKHGTTDTGAKNMSPNTIVKITQWESTTTPLSNPGTFVKITVIKRTLYNLM